MEYPPEYTGNQTSVDYPPKYTETQNLTDYKTEYPEKRHAESSQHALGPLDHEMLTEAENHEGHESQQQVHSEEHEEAELDKSLSWIRHAGGLHEVRNGMDLVVPVVVPQTAPGIRNPFSRAWSPLLTDHGVLPQDFLAFIDHLNVCKAASPPLQLLNLAGNIVGFTPVPFAWAISMGVSVASTAGIVAVSRVRIARYIERANKEYFHPRGLQARIAKQNTLPELVHQDSGAPILAPIPPNASFDSFPSLRDRRLMALGNHIAPIHFEASANVTTEGNMLDKLSAKMTARSAAKSERKMMEEHMKQQEDDMKESMKIQKDLQKARRKGEFADAAKLELELQQLQGGGEGVGKEWKAANKFLFVVVQSLKQVQAAAAQHHEVPQGLR